MMQTWQRELFTAMLRGLELIVVALRKVLDEDKRMRNESQTAIDVMKVTSYH
jgi:hypothetical protein